MVFHRDSLELKWNQTWGAAQGLGVTIRDPGALQSSWSSGFGGFAGDAEFLELGRAPGAQRLVALLGMLSPSPGKPHPVPVPLRDRLCPVLP